jgi:hypothetical protein
MNLEILAVVYIKFLFQNLLHKTEETTRVPQSEYLPVGVMEIGFIDVN